MAEMKTKQTDESVADFLAGIENDRRREDCEAVMTVMGEVTGEEPKLWGGSMIGFDRYDELMARLGKHRTGKSCLYVKALDDVDMDVLRELVEVSVAHMKKTYG